MTIIDWISGNYVEIAGAVAGILYVLLEIRQNPLLWPVGIITSSAYIYVFFTGKLYADMSLQVYYVIISFLGWYWWTKEKSGSGSKESAKGHGNSDAEKVSEPSPLEVSRLRRPTGMKLTAVFTALFIASWIVLDKFTDSPVPGADAFITTLSVIATWMLARKIYEHWYLWIIVNFSMSALCIIRGLYPTLVLYLVYAAMSFAGLKEWSKSLRST